VGSASLLDHLDGIHLTAEQREFLAQIRNPIRYESFRDLIVNQAFRRDIYVKGVVPIGNTRVQETWANLRFGLSRSAASVPQEIEGVKFHGTHRAIHQHVLEKLDSGPRTGRELLMGLDANLGSPAFRQVMIFLVGQGHCHVVPPEDGEDERVKRTEVLNRAILYDDREWNVLASPVLGGAVDVDQVTQLMLISAREKRDDPAGFIWNVLKSRGRKFVKDGKTLDSEEENIAEARQRVGEIQGGRAQVLAALKVY
jgi:Predicted methyltransferase regulatory domain